MGTVGRRSNWAGIGIKGTVYRYLLKKKEKTGKSFSRILEDLIKFKIAKLREEKEECISKTNKETTTQTD